MSRKIVQISSATWNGGPGGKRSMTLFALGDDGNVYSLEYDDAGAIAGGWVAVPALPDRLSQDIA